MLWSADLMRLMRDYENCKLGYQVYYGGFLRISCLFRLLLGCWCFRYVITVNHVLNCTKNVHFLKNELLRTV